MATTGDTLVTFQAGTKLAINPTTSRAAATTT